MSALDTINANGQDYDIMSPEVVSDYVEKIGTICKNPNGYTKGSLFLARDAQNVERMYKATSAIASNQTITSGTNCTVKKLGDLFNDVDSDVSQVKQALSDEAEVRAKNGAHNYLDISKGVPNNADVTLVNGVLTNTATDSRAADIFFAIRKGTTTLDTLLNQPLSSIGSKEYEITIPDGTDFDNVLIGHNGSSRDFKVTVPFSRCGSFKFSFYATGANTSTVGGYSLKDFMITDAEDSYTEFTPYAMTNRELTEKVDGIDYEMQYNGAYFHVIKYGDYYHCYSNSNFTSTPSIDAWTTIGSVPNTTNRDFCGVLIMNTGVILKVRVKADGDVQIVKISGTFESNLYIQCSCVLA